MHDGNDILFLFFHRKYLEVHTFTRKIPCCLLMKFILLHFNVRDKKSFILRPEFSVYQYLVCAHNTAFITFWCE